MAGDERRAEVEAAIQRAWNDPVLPGHNRFGSMAVAALEALDRLRDARGDDEAACTCTVTGVGSAGGRVLRPNDSCPVHARSPQGEDHEGEVEASDPRHNAAYRAVLDYCSHGIVGVGPFEAEAIVRLVERAVLSRVSPSRDGTVGDDHEAGIAEVLGLVEEMGAALMTTWAHTDDHWYWNRARELREKAAKLLPSRDGTVAVEALKDAEKELTLAAAHLLRFGHATAHDAVAEGRDRARAALAEFARSATGEQTDHGGDK